MKKITILLGLLFAIIIACMVYLVRSGVSLRSAPLIKPSVADFEKNNVANSLVVRLFPSLQNAYYVVWGVSPETDEIRQTLQVAQDDYEKLFKRPVQIIPDAENATLDQLKNCSNPCWLFLPQDKANELSENSLFKEKIHPLNQVYMTITYGTFSRDEEVNAECESQHRLSLECLRKLAIRESVRKMKEADKRYFFLRKYNETDHFLFVEEKKIKK